MSTVTSQTVGQTPVAVGKRKRKKRKSFVVVGAMTAEDFLDMPQDDGIDRELIGGLVWEKGVTYRTRFHANVEGRIAHLLNLWRDTNGIEGMIYSGEVGCVLSRDPERGNVVGIDVAFAAGDVEARMRDAIAALEAADTDTDQLTEKQRKERHERRNRLLQFPPTLAIEVHSPSDRRNWFGAKVQEYLHCGVELFWEVDPFFQTVIIHRPGAAPVMRNIEERLTGDPVLPRFDVPVTELFK